MAKINTVPKLVSALRADVGDAFDDDERADAALVDMIDHGYFFFLLF